MQLKAIGYPLDGLDRQGLRAGSYLVVPGASRFPGNKTDLWVLKWSIGNRVQFSAVRCALVEHGRERVVWVSTLPGCPWCRQISGKAGELVLILYDLVGYFSSWLHN